MLFILYINMNEKYLRIFLFIFIIFLAGCTGSVMDSSSNLNENTTYLNESESIYNDSEAHDILDENINTLFYNQTQLETEEYINIFSESEQLGYVNFEQDIYGVYDLHNIDMYRQGYLNSLYNEYEIKDYFVDGDFYQYHNNTNNWSVLKGDSYTLDTDSLQDEIGVLSFSEFIFEEEFMRFISMNETNNTYVFESHLEEESIYLENIDYKALGLEDFETFFVDAFDGLDFEVTYLDFKYEINKSTFETESLFFKLELNVYEYNNAFVDEFVGDYHLDVIVDLDILATNNDVSDIKLPEEAKKNATEAILFEDIFNEETLEESDEDTIVVDTP